MKFFDTHLHNFTLHAIMTPDEAARFAQHIFGRQNREHVSHAQAAADRIFSRRNLTQSKRHQQIKALTAQRKAEGLPYRTHAAQSGKRRRAVGDQVDDEERRQVLRSKRRAVAQNNHNSAERRAIRKKARPRGDPAVRCWDWMLHNGDMHYARNGSAFDTYEKINEEVSTSLRLEGEVKALGIGTVRLAAKRALDSYDVCAITLHDVLHIPSMPCNGISLLKLGKAGLHWTFGVGRGYMEVTELTGRSLFCGTRYKSLWRVVESRRPPEEGEPEAERPLEECEDLPSVNVRALDSAKMAYKGWLQREFRETKQNLGFRLLENDCEVEC